MYDPSMRVLTVLELLQTKARVTGAELARRLEVSPRSVQRYVARLQDLGFPVESTRGVGGAYRLSQGFRVPPLMFTDEEAFAVSLGLRALRPLGLEALAPATAGVQAKLERVLPQAIVARVRATQDAIDWTAPYWVTPTSAELIINLAAAVQSQRLVRLVYRARDGTRSQRDVEGYGVVHHEGSWYLVGHCRTRQGRRVFRLDRVLEVKKLEERFVRPEAFDARAYLLKTLPFASYPWRAEVWLSLSLPEAQQRMPASWLALEAEGEGTCLRCGVEDLEWLAATLLGLGCELEVRQPEQLRAAFGAVANRAAGIAQAQTGLSKRGV